MERIIATLSVLYVLVAIAAATTPIMLSECSTLDQPLARYHLAQNIVINDDVDDSFVCFDITHAGITIDGIGFGIYGKSFVDATAVQYAGMNATVQNLQISNVRTGIRAKGEYGRVHHNAITGAASGIDVNAAHNDISHNTISASNVADTASGIYVFFPSAAPTPAFVSITNNVITNIQGESFALGIAVYYATAVYAAHNTISNLKGGISDEISVIEGEVEIKGNVFGGQSEETFTIPSAILLSCAVVIISAMWYASPQSTVVDAKAKKMIEVIQKEKVPQILKEVRFQEVKEEEVQNGADVPEIINLEKEKEMEMEADGADSIPLRRSLTFEVASSPPARTMDL